MSVNEKQRRKKQKIPGACKKIDVSGFVAEGTHTQTLRDPTCTRIAYRSSDPTFVRKLLALHNKYRALVHEQFSGHSLFQKALKDAFEVFINKVSSDCDGNIPSTSNKLICYLPWPSLSAFVVFSCMVSGFANVHRMWAKSPMHRCLVHTATVF